MLEKVIERRLMYRIKKMGGLALKFTSPGHAGVPDRLVLMPGGHVFFVELKQEKGVLTPLQIETHNQLRALGCEVRTLYGAFGVDCFLEEVKPYAVQPVQVPEGGGELDPFQ